MYELPFPPSEDLSRLAPQYYRLLEDEPLTKVRTPAGDEAWLACGYDLVRDLASSPVLRRGHRTPESAARINDSVVQGGPTEEFDGELERHTRMRKLLTPAFSAKRMLALQESVEERVDALLDELPGPPADLHAALSQRLPAMVICTLVGAPYEDYELFRSWTSRLSGTGDPEAGRAAQIEFGVYMAELLERKKREPSEDVFSDLAAAGGVELPEAARLAAALLFAGYETTMSRIDLGTVLFIRNPAQWAKLTADPGLVTGAVEEVLRMVVTNIQDTGGSVRYAAEDLTAGDTTIPAGDAVLLAHHAANRDPRVFERPDEFDITRSPNPHLGFGHGMRYCVGNTLARIELRAVFGALAKRFPGLHLAADGDAPRRRAESVTGGVTELAVSW
ncbi:cytochrome P450 [Amycolatopsis sp. A1MSW2902]|uniref:cytochrome P450 n=1 Tax=Amycolatopsis sp. A1MSW2902 TaxID=687413 RepID=UPI00307E2485